MMAGPVRSEVVGLAGVCRLGRRGVFDGGVQKQARSESSGRAGMMLCKFGVECNYYQALFKGPLVHGQCGLQSRINDENDFYYYAFAVLSSFEW